MFGGPASAAFWSLCRTAVITYTSSRGSVVVPGMNVGWEKVDVAHTGKSATQVL